MQSISAEMNLSETAFALPLESGPMKSISNFSLRWFTPSVEVPLCGHATLATAAVLFSDIGTDADSVSFQTLSGTLVAKREHNGILLDFPADNPVAMDKPVELLRALGIDRFLNILYGRKTKMLMIHLQSGETVKNLEPHIELMKKARTREDFIGVIVTAAGKPPYDFISRFFAPWVGVDEDPVTGSAHTVLAPYWSRISGKKEMIAHQASARGGNLTVRLCDNDRVALIGNAVIVLKGELFL